jgi:hypothetical protein
MWNVPLVRRSPWHLAQLLVGVFVALVLACSPNGEASAPPDSNLDPAIAPTGSVTPSSNVDATPDAAPATVRLASHRFVSVGDQHSIEDLGELIEVVHLSEPPAVAINGTTALAEAGGISCLRFQYRTAVDENTVQTQCVVAFDETGDCTDLEPLRLDLLTFLDQGAASTGEANMLASGDGRFYATCRSDSGAYRLQQPSEELPPPYFHIVDALGDGAYSLGDSEFDAQRAGTIETFSGETLDPAWIVNVSLEVAWLELSADGFTANTEDCSAVPSCSPSSLVVRPGDLLRVSMGLDTSLVREFAEQAHGTLLDSYLGERIGVSWTDVSALSDNPRDATLMRLISLDVMDQALEKFDRLYGLREREITVVYAPFWAVQELSNLCEPSERAACEALEEALSAEETRRIARLRESGFYPLARRTDQLRRRRPLRLDQTTHPAAGIAIRGATRLDCRQLLVRSRRSRGGARRGGD